MKGARTTLLVASLAVVMLFTGALLASRNTQDVLFRALGNLAEVVHLVETEYVDELNQEALSMSLDAGLVEPLDRSAAVLPVDQIGAYLEFVESPPPFGLGLTSRLGSAAVQYVLSGSPAEAAGLATWEVIELVEGVNSRGRPLWQIRLELMERQNNGESITLTVFDREVDDRRDVVLEPTAGKPRAATSELQDEATVIHIEAVPEGAIQEVVKLIPENGNLIPHGDFAVLLLKAALGYTDTLPDPETALELVKGYGLVAEDWQVDTGLTHGELAEVLQRFGVVYLPADVDQPASQPYVEAMLRRELSRLRDYLARRLGHGFSVNHVLDQGVDRAVSSSTFD